jgi:hypothetical protein
MGNIIITIIIIIIIIIIRYSLVKITGGCGAFIGEKECKAEVTGNLNWTGEKRLEGGEREVPLTLRYDRRDDKKEEVL